MIWEEISYNSRTPLVLQNTMMANVYVRTIIGSVILLFMNSIERGLFQQDNARPHTTAVNSLRDDVLLWPAISPDLSLIEHVRDMIGRRLRAHPQPATTITDLTIQVQQVWDPTAFHRMTFDIFMIECLRIWMLVFNVAVIIMTIKVQLLYGTTAYSMICDYIT